MRIAIDMDEVLYSWERTARYLLRNEYAKPEWMYWDALQQPFSEWSIAGQIGQAAERWLFTEGVELGLYRHGHVVTGAMRGVRRLKAEGHELVVVTHRLEGGVQDTLAWIDFHFGREDPYPWSGIEILSDGRSKTTVPFDRLIDDSPKNIADARAVGRDGVLFGASWNMSDITWEDI